MQDKKNGSTASLMNKAFRKLDVKRKVNETTKKVVDVKPEPVVTEGIEDDVTQPVVDQPQEKVQETSTP